MVYIIYLLKILFNIKTDEERLYEFIQKLARKFYLRITYDDLDRFIKNIRIFVWETDNDSLNPVDKIMYDEFKNLFWHYDNGRISSYTLPKQKYFITREYALKIAQEANEIKLLDERKIYDTGN